MSFLWPCLENLRGLNGVPALWRCWLGDNFAAIHREYLDAQAELAVSYPCAEECGCAHRLMAYRDDAFIAVCTCDPCHCEDFIVTMEEAAILGLNWTRLGRAICRAFEGDYRETELPLPFTRQIGSKFASAVPVVLTIQSDREGFRQMVAGLIARLGKPFILLGPTSRWLDADTLGLLRAARSEFFDLTSHLELLPGGVLQSRTIPGELFSCFQPAGDETAGQKEASRVFALMKVLGSSAKKAPLDAVFRRLVLEGQSQEQAAKELQCSKALLSLRVAEIEKRMRMSLAQLRGLGSHLGEMAATVQNRRTGYRQVIAEEGNEKEEENF